MTRLHLALPLLASLLACGGTSTTPMGPTVEGDSHDFVVSGLVLPESTSQAAEFGLDLDDKPNDGVDNNFGQFLGVSGVLFPGGAPNQRVAYAVDHGASILLMDLQATDLENASNAGVHLSEAVTDPPPTPAPCADSGDTICRGHLGGDGSFVVDSGAPTGGTLYGSVMAGVFSGAAIEPITLRLALEEGTLELPLHLAKIELEGVGGATPTGKLGGAIAVEDFGPVYAYAALAGQVFIDRDCWVEAGSCVCSEDSDGAALLGIYGGGDCLLDSAEAEAVLGSLITPDLDTNVDGTFDAVSLGLALAAAPAVVVD